MVCQLNYIQIRPGDSGYASFDVTPDCWILEQKLTSVALICQRGNLAAFPDETDEIVGKNPLSDCQTPRSLDLLHIEADCIRISAGS